MKKWITILFASITLTSTSQVRLPAPIGDSMVLQRDQPLKIWGWASPGEKLEIDFGGKKYKAVTSDNKKWELTLPAMKAGGPYTMHITGSNSIQLRDIMIGDVWICGGQSNMEVPMSRVKELYPQELATANNKNIRQVTIAIQYDFHGPREEAAAGRWQTVNTQAIPQFSAVGYFFAKELYRLYKIPIGLIKTSSGGTPAEGWLSEEGLKQFPEYAALKERFKDDAYLDSIKRAEAAVNDKWYVELWRQDKGMQETVMWYDTTYDASQWPTMLVPGYWDDRLDKPVDGVAWFRKELDIPAHMTNRAALLRLGTIVDRDSTFVNGKFVGSIAYQYPPRIYPLPPGLIHAGKNIIVVKIINSGGRGGFYFDKPYYLALGKDTIDLKSTWQFKIAATSAPLPSSTTFQYLPGGVYNAMIAPIGYYPAKGVIWYQGESNTGRPDDYEAIFSRVILDWRKNWKQPALPFLFVQLANYNEAATEPVESGWAELREAQRKTLKVPNTAMAVAIDLGDWNELHPFNKQDVGRRLALAARRLAYGNKNIVASGPIYQSMKIEKNKIILSFTNTGTGLLAKNRQELQQFAIAGADKKYKWAKAVIRNNKVEVWHPDIPRPVAVRYAWADNPAGANLYNKEGLPASPFSTDNK